MNALEFLERVQRFYAAEDYVSALTEIAAAESEGKATVELLLCKAACIQLSSDTDYPLRKALEIYESILRHVANDARVLAQAGFFLLNVEDNAAAAQGYLSRAVSVYAESLAEVMTSLGKAKGETGSSTETVVAEIDEAFERLKSAVVQRLQADQ